MALGHLLYISDADEALTSDDIEAIRTVSARNNAVLDITGILFYSNGHFVQFLEGDPEAVHGLFDTIVEDDRHDNVKLLFERPSPERVFTDWDMALLDLDEYTDKERLDLDDLVHLAGYQVRANERPIELVILERFRALLPTA